MPPSCQALGPQCRALRVLLRVTDTGDGIREADEEATWLLGHTERIGFGKLQAEGSVWWTEAELRVPCRFLREGPQESHCQAHGFRGRVPLSEEPEPSRRRLGGDDFHIVEGGKLVTRALPLSPRSLPILSQDNPCYRAPCRTSDHRRGSACCRDLQIDIRCPASETELELLVRARRPPLLCKVSRLSDELLNAEMISACGYLDDPGSSCALHGRQRADGSLAKPGLCHAWPEPEDVMHPGCAFTATLARAVE